MIWSWIGKLLLFLLGGLLLLQALLLKIKADRTASLVELAFSQRRQSRSVFLCSCCENA